MKLHGITIGTMMGSVCLVFALVPGLFQSVMDGIRSFRDSIEPGSPMRQVRRTGDEDLRKPIWLVVIGAMLIALSLFAYLSN
jgi:hypothetical protein